VTDFRRIKTKAEIFTLKNVLFCTKKWFKMIIAKVLRNSAAIKLPTKPPMAEMCPVLSSQIVKKMCLNQKNK
jgi:hypothetical protein